MIPESQSPGLVYRHAEAPPIKYTKMSNSLDGLHGFISWNGMNGLQRTGLVHWSVLTVKTKLLSGLFE